MAKVKPVPDGFHRVTPHLVVRDAAAAIEFYRKAFGAEELYRMPGPDGKSLWHAEVQIGDCRIMLCDEMPQMQHWVSPAQLKGTAVGLHLYVEDCDAVFNRAVAAGCKPMMPLTDMFWGDRYGSVVDPFGHVWSVATHKQDLTPVEMMAGAKKFMEACGGS
ncbi:MAG: VOC family protein [Phycisphaerae bacterium]